MFHLVQYHSGFVGISLALIAMLPLPLQLSRVAAGYTVRNLVRPWFSFHQSTNHLPQTLLLRIRDPKEG